MYLCDSRELRLFIDEKKLDKETYEYLSKTAGGKASKVLVRPYGEILRDIDEVIKKHKDSGRDTFKFLVSGCNQAIATQIKASTGGDDSALIEAPLSPISASKAVKNSAEVKGMRNAHIKDAVASLLLSALA